MVKLNGDECSCTVNLMLNISGYDEETLFNLISILTESRVRIPGLRLTFYNCDTDYQFPPELIIMLENYVKYTLLKPRYSDGVKMLTAEVRRQHVILTENNMLVHAAAAAGIKTVILPDSKLQQSGSNRGCSGNAFEKKRLISQRKQLFFRRLKSELINALEEAAYDHS